jgi:hypothetical protein
MTYVLDAGGVTRLACDRAVVSRLRHGGHWPPEVPAVVLVEALTGDHRRDHPTNRLLTMCMVRDTDEPQARRAGTLRTATGRAGGISAVDALVVAVAETVQDPRIISSDPRDMADLVAQCDRPIKVLPV